MIPKYKVFIYIYFYFEKLSCYNWIWCWLGLLSWKLRSSIIKDYFRSLSYQKAEVYLIVSLDFENSWEPLKMMNLTLHLSFNKVVTSLISIQIVYWYVRSFIKLPCQFGTINAISIPQLMVSLLDLVWAFISANLYILQKPFIKCYQS